MKCSNCEQDFCFNIPENHTTFKMYKITMITWTCNRCNTENRNYSR